MFVRYFDLNESQRFIRFIHVRISLKMICFILNVRLRLFIKNFKCFDIFIWEVIYFVNIFVKFLKIYPNGFII